MSLSGAELALITFSISTAAMFVFAGYAHNTASAWKWIDVLYYPLCAIGVILFFISTENVRSLVTLQSRLDSKTRQLAEHESKRPQVRADSVSLKLVAGGLEVFGVIANHSKSCRVIGSATADCSARAKLADLLSTSIPEERIRGLIGAGDPIRAAADFCQGVDSLVNAIAADGRSQAYEFLRDHYKAVKAGNYSVAAAGALGERFSKAAKDETQKILEVAYSADERKKLQPYLIAETDLAISIFYGAWACIFIPRELSTGEYQRWDDAFTSYEKEVGVHRKEIEERARLVISNPTRDLRFEVFFRLLWPYILVLALSLKLGKAITGLRGDRRI